MFFRPLIITALLLALMTGVLAQTPTGSLSGVVIDSRGGVVRGARVVVLQSNRIAISETVSNERGEFLFLNLLAGNYTVSAEKDGMTQPGGAQPITIEPGRVLQGSVILTVAAIEDSLVVSATRTETRLTETPARAYLASGSDLLRAQRVTLFDALRSAPGVSTVQTARRGGITGIFVRGGESDYTKVLIDGVPANDAGGAFDLADLTTDNVARVELVRGAQSAIYGSDAMTGVLQIFTHRGSASDSGIELALEGGSFGFNREAARFSGLRRALDYSLGFTHLQTKGRGRNDDYENRVASVNLGYRFNIRSQGRVTIRNENSGNGTPGPTANLYADPDERIRRRRFVFSGRADDQTTNYWHQSVTYAYSANHQLSFDPASENLFKPTTPLDNQATSGDFSYLFSNHQRRLGVRYQSDLVIENGHFFTSGVDYETEQALFDSGFDGRNRVDSSRASTGIFVQDQFSYGSRIYFNAGLRIENNRASLPAALATILSQLGSKPYTGDIGFGTKLLPKVALTWVIRQSGLLSRRGPTRLHANYGEGIKAPSLVEAFSPNQYFLGNPALRPEQAQNFDIGLEQMIWRDKYRVEFNYFDNRFRDQIAFVGNPTTFGGPVTLADGRLTSFINNDRARARGYELIFNARPLRQLQITGNYSFLISRLISAADVIDYSTSKLIANPEVGLTLLRRPRNSGAVNLSWLGERFDVNLDAFVVGERRDIDPVTSARLDAQKKAIVNPGYSRIDIAGSFRISKSLSIFARVENLLNRNYQEVLGYPAYRLTFSSGIRIRF